MSNLNRLRGLRALLEDAVEHGTSAVERVHRATAARPFEVLDLIAPIAPAARGVRVVHDVTVAGVYETIRQVNHLVGVTLSAAIDLYDVGVRDPGPGDPGPGDPRRTSQADQAPAVTAASVPAVKEEAVQEEVPVPALNEEENEEEAEESRG